MKCAAGSLFAVFLVCGLRLPCSCWDSTLDFLGEEAQCVVIAVFVVVGAAFVAVVGFSRARCLSVCFERPSRCFFFHQIRSKCREPRPRLSTLPKSKDFGPKTSVTIIIIIIIIHAEGQTRLFCCCDPRVLLALSFGAIDSSVLFDLVFGGHLDFREQRVLLAVGTCRVKTLDKTLDKTLELTPTQECHHGFSNLSVSSQSWSETAVRNSDSTGLSKT